MTVFEFCAKQAPQTVNSWITLIDRNGLSKHESTILSVADDMGLITIKTLLA